MTGARLDALGRRCGHDAVVDRGARRRRSRSARRPRCAAPASPWTPGEILAVMGPSGSGKSTLLHCLAGILVPDSGEIHFDGRRVDTMAETERSSLRRDRFGFVFQFGQLVPELTAEENVALPLLLSGVRRTQALREAGRLVRAARPGRAGAAPVRRAVRRAGPAGRAGPRPGRRAGGPLRRRADRRARLAHRRAGHGPAGRRRPRAGHHGHPGHPRARVAAYADREVIVRDGRVNSLAPDRVAS